MMRKEMREGAPLRAYLPYRMQGSARGSRFPTASDVAEVLAAVKSAKSKPSLDELYTILVALANAAVDRHDPPKALAFAIAAEALNSELPQAYNAAGRAHATAKNYTAAVDCYEAALRLNRNPVYINNLEPIAKLYVNEPDFWVAARSVAPDRPMQVLEALPPEKQQIVRDYLAAQRARKLIGAVSKNQPLPPQAAAS